MWSGMLTLVSGKGRLGVLTHHGILSDGADRASNDVFR